VAYARYARDGAISQTVALGWLADSATTKIIGTEFISRDSNVSFSEQSLVDRRYRGLFAVLDPEYPFDYLFLAGGAGCRDTGSIQPIEWESTAGNYMDSYLFSSFEPTLRTQRRNWQAIYVEPGILGDRYWVIEHADFNGPDPSNVFIDPAITPGRINSYEFVEDLTGQVDLCGP